MPLPPDPGLYATPSNARPSELDLLPLTEYDYLVISFSGGKDSTALLCRLLDLGVPLDRIELWHQSVDGCPGQVRFFDWPLTEAYCTAFARALGLRLYHQCKVAGFRGELYRIDERSAPTVIELEDGTPFTCPAGHGNKPNTRMRFPMKSNDPLRRWCTYNVKTDPAKKQFTNDPRFQGKKALILTGERRQESENRAKYAEVTDYASAPSKGRIVHRWRAILNHTEEQVWELISRYRIRPHPVYYLGWGRLSCMACIYGDEDQWASLADVNMPAIAEIAAIEMELRDFWARNAPPGQAPFGGTIWPDGTPLLHVVFEGRSWVPGGTDALRRLVLSEGPYPPEKIRLDLGEVWELPCGAFKRTGGPT